MPNDAYADVRQLPLRHVFAAVGITTEWKSRKADTEWYGKCCFHEAVKNNTSLSFDAEGKYHCFSCQAKGKGAIDALMRLKRIGFSQAVDFLRSNFGNIIAQQAARPQIKQLQVTDNESGGGCQPIVNQTENPPFKSTYDKYAVESAWLSNKGFTPETLARYEVFEYNNPARKSVYSGSVMLKIRRWCDGECVGYLSRNIGEVTPEKPKYLLPKGLSKGLEVFGAWQIKNSGQKLPLRVAYAVESPFTVMKFAQLGLPAVSCFGWSVSAQQAEIMAAIAKGWIFLPDRNKYAEAVSVAGELSRRAWVKMPELPDGVDDPEQLTGDQIRSLMT